MSAKRKSFNTVFSEKTPLQLKDLLSQVTKKNLHSENNHIRVGKEIW